MAIRYLSLLRESSERHRCIAEFVNFTPTGASVFEPIPRRRAINQFEFAVDLVNERNEIGIEEEDIGHEAEDLRSPITRVLGSSETPTVALACGKLAEQLCRHEDARHFYRLANAWSSLVDLECSIISSAAERWTTDREAMDLVESGIESYDLIHHNARQTYDFIAESHFPVAAGRLDALRLLVGILWCAVLHEQERFEEVITQADLLELLPRSPAEIGDYRDRLFRFPDEVRACLPHLTLMVITAYRRKYDESVPDKGGTRRVDALVALMPELVTWADSARAGLEAASGLHLFSQES
jgi:hypothetical protein